MTPREKKLVRVFAILCAFASISFVCLLYIDEYGRVTDEILKREKLFQARQDSLREIREYEALLGGLAEVTTGESPRQTRAINEEVAYIKAELLRQSIKPERLSISGKEKSETIDFYLKTSPIAILRFLKRNPRPGTDYRYGSISIKQNRDPFLVETHIRILHESKTDTH